MDISFWYDRTMESCDAYSVYKNRETNVGASLPAIDCKDTVNSVFAWICKWAHLMNRDTVTQACGLAFFVAVPLLVVTFPYMKLMIEPGWYRRLISRLYIFVFAS